MGQAAELEAGLAEREEALIETNRVGWHFLHFMRDSLTSGLGLAALGYVIEKV